MRRYSFPIFVWLVLATTVGVIVWGAYVRATLSGDGCGTHWPTCGGEIIPDAKLAKTVIEFSHRLTSLFLIGTTLVMLVWSFLSYPKGHIVRTGAKWTFGFLMVEALVGAGLVLFKLVAHNPSSYRAVAMCAHLSNTLLLVAGVTLTAWWSSGGAKLQLRANPHLARLWAVCLFSVVVLAITGTLSALGDTLYPSNTLVEGIRADFAPNAATILKTRPLHPATATIVSLLAAYTIATTFRECRSLWVKRLALPVVAVLVGQYVFGFINLISLAPVWMQMTHLLLANLLWIGLVLLGAAGLSEPVSATAELQTEQNSSEEVRPAWSKHAPSAS